MKQLLTVTLLILTLSANSQTSDSTYTQPRKDTIIVYVQPQPVDAGKVVGTILLTTVVISVVTFAIPLMFIR